MEAFQLALLLIAGYIFIFSIVHRICNCIEHCANAKSYGKFVANLKQPNNSEETNK